MWVVYNDVQIVQVNKVYVLFCSWFRLSTTCT